MDKLSKTGKKVARRSFAALMALLLCTTTLGTNFWGFGSQDSSSIVSSFEAFAADTATYGPDETYYDAGTLNMTAYYDGTTSTTQTSVDGTYHDTNWDVTRAESYVSSETQNNNKGVTILSTTDVADAKKYGSASEVKDGGDGTRGIMCFSEYLNALNGTTKPGDADYNAYEKSVPDYEAPAGVDTVTYQYMAKGETSATQDGKTEIQWTLFAWPIDQHLKNQTADDIKAALDTPAEIEAEWNNINTTSITKNGVTLAVPGELVNGNDIQDAGENGAKDTTSLFYNGQPEWASGNKGAFDTWNKKSTYLMNRGLWSRIETNPVKIVENAGKLSVDGTPTVNIALYTPDNKSDVYANSDIKAGLTEDNDTIYLPLYASVDETLYKGDLKDMTLQGILDKQSDKNKKDIVVPTYNIRQQLKSLWETTRSKYLMGQASLDCKKALTANTTDDAFTYTADKVITGVRLYGIASYPRIGVKYINDNKADFGITNQITTTSVSLDGEKDGSPLWNSAAQNGEFYGTTDANKAVFFVFNENDIDVDTVHIDKIPGNVFNLSDIYSAYDATLAKTDAATVVNNGEDVPNTLIPYLIRSDAYYDVTDDYQRAAGVLYGRIDKDTITLDTNAVNKTTDSKTAKPVANDTIVDTVTYTGLKLGEKYTLEGTIYKSTDTGFATPIATANTPFTANPAAGSGSETVTFTFDSSAKVQTGDKLVVTEVLKDAKGAVIAEHKDLNDADQTIFYTTSNVITVAASGTGSKYLDAVDAETIVDKVTVSNLDPSTTYTAKATLYDVTADKLVTDANNNTLSWQKTFATNDKGEGSVEVTIENFMASDKAGHKLVVYEDIIDKNGKVVGTHADKNDADQTVTVNTAGITTVLTDKDGNKDMASSDSMIFKDTINYTGLVSDNIYYMVSTLVDKETGKVLTDAKGNEAIVKSTTFRANDAGTNAGSSTFTFSNMASTMSGKTVVAYNDLYRVFGNVSDKQTVTDKMQTALVASERDLANVKQTVAIDATIIITEPTIDTVAKGVDDSKTIPLATNSTIKDTVSYVGLTPGKTYTLTADVYDTNTQQRAVGYTKVITMDFVASDEGKGDIVMTIDLNTMELAGHKLVVYETLSMSDTTVAKHRDLTDEDQTVTVGNEFQASIDTVATDKATGGKTLMASADAVILDKVSYDGLDTSASYTLTTTVYDKTTGAKCDSIEPVTTTFTPEEEKGTIEVSIPVDGTKFTSGQSLVVYEELKTSSETIGTNNKGTKKKTMTVATHKDISDADQTVTFVKMSTYLTGDGTSAKAVHVGSDAYVIDTASFTGLTPNRTYVITTQLLDVAASSGAITLDTNTANTTASGQAVASRVMEFTPTTANGSVATQINVNTTGLSGHSLVAVATVKDKTTGQTVATHMDKANVDQTITVQTRVEAQTGVTSSAWIFGIIALIMLSACASYGIGLYSDKKHNR